MDGVSAYVVAVAVDSVFQRLGFDPVRGSPVGEGGKDVRVVGWAFDDGG